MTAPRNVAEAIVWAGVGKIAGKEATRELLPIGQHKFELALAAHAGGVDVAFAGEATLIVNPDQECLQSTTPDPPRVVALLLSYLPKRTRAAVLRDFAAKFGEVAVDEETHAQAATLLETLRAKSTVTKRGSVSCPYSLTR